MVIAELQARLTVIDINDNLVSYLGANDKVAEVEGWPNNLNEKGETVPTTLLTPGKFNSPHGMAVDASGNLYLAEWLIGAGSQSSPVFSRRSALAGPARGRRNAPCAISRVLR